MLVALLTVKLVAAVLPNSTAVAPLKPVPVMVTVVPPWFVPLDGDTEVTVGGGPATVALAVPGTLSVIDVVVSICVAEMCPTTDVTYVLAIAGSRSWNVKFVLAP